MTINQTPRRTSRNFLINNINLDNLEIPQNFTKFNNVIISEGDYALDDNIDKKNLVYGLGKEIEENVFQYANSKLRIKSNQNTIRIIYNFDDNNLNLINFIQIEAEGKTNIIIEYRSNTDKKCFHNGIIKVLACKNADVNVTIVNLMNSISENLESMENTIEENANINYTIIDMGGKRSIQNYYSNILGKCAKNDLKTVYLAQNDELKDINYIVDLRGEETYVDIDVQGALNDNSKKNFKGTIDFKKGCKKAKGNENEYCMILSDKAKSIALPMLLCTEEDVEGNHSTASRKSRRRKIILYYVKGI